MMKKAHEHTNSALLTSLLKCQVQLITQVKFYKKSCIFPQTSLHPVFNVDHSEICLLISTILVW